LVPAGFRSTSVLVRLNGRWEKPGLETRLNRYHRRLLDPIDSL